MFMHIDMDTFFVSAERSRDHSLTGIPVAVGSRSNLEIFARKRIGIKLMNDNSGAFVSPVFYASGKRSFEEYFVDHDADGRRVRGVVATSSYEAREKGVRTGMALAAALRICPELVVIPSDLLFYHRISHEISLFLKKIVPRVEQYSIDEFFGDLGGWKEAGEIESFAAKVQHGILDEFGIPVSIGIAGSKWTAKLATKFAKPYGVLRVDNTEEFIRDIPISAFPGIGKGYRKRLASIGIEKLGEISSQRKLFCRWGKSGERLYRRILGIDNETIEPGKSRQSIGISRTFDPLGDSHEIERRIMIIARHISYITLAIGANPVIYRLKLNCRSGIRLKMSKRVERVFSELLFKKVLAEMFSDIFPNGCEVVKISISVSDFTHMDPRTLSLIDLDLDLKMARLGKAIHAARTAFGIDSVKTANEL